jgi:DNA-binding IclR family transcriptional regulator
MSKRTDSLFVQSLAKGLRLLECFADRPSPMSLNDLAEACDVDRSTVQRMTHTLVAMGYLERGSNGRGYVMGKKTLDRAFDYLRGVPLLERATPIMVELQRESAERVELSLFDGLTIIFALRRQTKRQAYTMTLIGRRLPTIYTAGGRAVLSHLPADQVDRILADTTAKPFTPKTITDHDLIRAEIETARRKGYALSSEESALGEVNLACAILDHQQLPIGAVHISAALSDWSRDEFEARFSPLVVNAAKELSGKVGLS